MKLNLLKKFKKTFMIVLLTIIILYCSSYLYFRLNKTLIHHVMGNGHFISLSDKYVFNKCKSQDISVYVKLHKDQRQKFNFYIPLMQLESNIWENLL